MPPSRSFSVSLHRAARCVYIINRAKRDCLADPVLRLYSLFLFSYFFRFPDLPSAMVFVSIGLHDDLYNIFHKQTIQPFKVYCVVVMLVYLLIESLQGIRGGAIGTGE